MRYLLCLFALLSASAVVRAQETPAPLTFEVVAETHYDRDGLNFRDLLFAPDSTLLGLANRGLFDLLHPYSGSWTRRERGGIGDDGLYLVTLDTLFVTNSDLRRSYDGGYTWEFAFPDSDAFVELSPDAPGGTALLTDGRDFTTSPVRETVARSTDSGLTWTPHASGPSVLDRVFIRSLAYAPAQVGEKPIRSVGTVVGVGIGGAAYSTDGGVTWQASSLDNAFGYQADYVIHAPLADLFVAGVNGPAPDGGDPRGGVWTSEDGVAWTFRGRVPSDSDVPVDVIEGPNGVWWSVVRGYPDGGVFSSEDGGTTWTERGRLNGEALTGQEFLRTNAVAIGPDGRVWLATSGQPGNEGAGAILRSAERVVVASEPDAAPGKRGEAVVLGVPYPNPSRPSAVTVPLVLAAAADVQVIAYDLLGREVAVLAEGRTTAGGHLLALDTASLAAGVYVVRATVAGQTAMQRLTVVE